MKNTRIYLMALLLPVFFVNCKKEQDRPTFNWSVKTLVKSPFDERSMNPVDMICDSKGSIFALDDQNEKVIKVTQTGELIKVAGGPHSGYNNGPGDGAEFHQMMGITMDAQENILIAENWNRCIRKIDPSGFVSTVAGRLDGYMSTPSVFGNLTAIAEDGSGNLYVWDNFYNKIFKIDANGTISTYAGNGIRGYTDGAALQACFSAITDMAFDNAGNLYATESGNNTVRKISTTGIVTTLAGNGQSGFKDGKNTDAQFWSPVGLAIDKNNTIYVADANNKCIRMIDPSGVVSTLTVTDKDVYPNSQGAAHLDDIQSITIDKEGAIYIGEWGHIRKITRIN